MNFIEAIIAILTAFCSLLTGFLDYGTPSATSTVELVREDKLVFDQAMYAGQGITTDGEYYYTSGSLVAVGLAGIAKWDADTMELVAKNDDPIPEYYKDLYGSDHVGGISYYDGKIYAAVENDAEDFPLVVTYDAETLEELEIYKLPNADLPDGIPWCAVDGDNGYLYCSPFNETDYILAFDLETMEFSHMIGLSETVYRIQGGEVYDGVLYLSYDVANSNDDKILTVDIGTGEVDSLCTRSLPSMAGNEAEGITVFPMADGSFIHVLDYDKTVGVYIRHYEVKE